MIVATIWETSGLDTQEDWLRRDRLAMAAIKIPKKYQDASYHHPAFDTTRQVPQWLDTVFKPSGRHSAILLGGTGCGKTFGAVAYAIREAKVWLVEGKECSVAAKFLTAYDLSLMLERKDWAALDRLRLIQWLIIDELGTEPAGFKGQDFLAHFENLFKRRFEDGLHTLITANLTFQQLETQYGQRIISRLHEDGKVLEVTDSDFWRKAN